MALVNEAGRKVKNKKDEKVRNAKILSVKAACTVNHKFYSM